MPKSKVFVIDTNVILHDHECIYHFNDNDVILPITVLEELDRFKRGNDQINFQVPTISQTGPVSVFVILNPGSPNELKSDQGTVTLTRYSPAFFTFGASKSIAATTVDGKILAAPALVVGGVSAKPGDVITLYATGLGFSNPVYQAGEVPDGIARVNDPYTITIGGTQLAPADILYAGLAPGLISGVFQLNVRLPQTLSDGDIPVVITIGGVTTQSGTTVPVKR